MDQTIDKKISVEAVINDDINYALWQNHVPVVRFFNITNIDTQDISDIVLSMKFEPEIAKEYEYRIDTIPAGTTLNISPVETVLSPEFLYTLNEKTGAYIHVEVRSAEGILYAYDKQLSILAFNEWSGISFMPETLASFVVPNCEQIKQVLDRSAQILRSFGKDGDLAGYQTNNPNNVRLYMAAVFEAIKEYKINYITSAASFEQRGQKIRLSDSVLIDRQANCLDLTLLYCSCLEACGLNPFVALTKGHAFAGCWLENSRFPEVVNYDISSISKRFAKGINEVAVVECTLMTEGGSDFDTACRKAEQSFDDPDAFELSLDIKRARLCKVLPLPMRTIADGKYVLAKAPEKDDSISSLTESEDIEKIVFVDGEPVKLSKEKLWERKLLDLGLRNPLVSFKPNMSNIQLMISDLRILEDAISSGKSFKILPKPEEFKALVTDNKMYDINACKEEIGSLMNSEFESQSIRSFVTETELANSLKKIKRQSVLSMEEGGTNTLYLALGFLKWYESDISEKVRYAPLVMIPVNIVKKLSHNYYEISLRDEDAQFNITLLELLKQDFGINIAGLDPLPLDESGLDIDRIFGIVRHAVMGKKRWDVAELAFLGIFSFSSFIMWNDLHNKSDELKKNQVVNSLIEGVNLVDDASDVKNLDLDENVRPSDLGIATSVDSSQLKAVIAAGKGQSYVLFGPPGTGKSQTITNIITNALYQGKSVLFVAEKMAALNVVKSRLEKIGLGPFSLELHSNKAQKRNVLDQFAKTLEVGHIKEPESYQAKADELYKQRCELNSIVEKLHKPQNCGYSLYELIEGYESGNAFKDRFAFSRDFVKDFDKQAYDCIFEAIDNLCASHEALSGKASAFYPFTDEDYSVERRDEIEASSKELLEKASAFDETFRKTATDFKLINGRTRQAADLIYAILIADKINGTVLRGILEAADFDSLKPSCEKLMESLRDYSALKEELLNNFTGAILSVNPYELKTAYDEANASFMLVRNKKLSKVAIGINAYSKGNVTVGKDNVKLFIDKLINLKQKEEEITAIPQTTTNLFAEVYTGKDTDITLINAAYEKSLKLREAVGGYRKLCPGYTYTEKIEAPEFEKAYVEFDEILRKFIDNFKIRLDKYYEKDDFAVVIKDACGKWLENITFLRDYCVFIGSCNKLNGLGLNMVTSALLSESIKAAQIAPAVRSGLNYRLIAMGIEAEPELKSFTGSGLNEKIRNYKAITAEFERLTINELVAKLSANIPVSGTKASQSSELGILQKAIKSGGRMMSIRMLFEKIPSLIKKMYPCMLMSPMSVAQYIDPSNDMFDLVVFDEASQLPTSEAVGAISRGKSVVVVGDPNQLPPTSFFAANQINEDDYDIEDMESVLDDCLAIGLPSWHLLWHYRSRHESLIAYSNARYYDNKLFTFPSPNDMASKVNYVLVEGTYDKGGRRTNRTEADAVADDIIGRLKDPERCKDSIGVVTFSVAQQGLIEDVLTEKLEKDHEAAEAALKLEEPIFIKNLENVQGDERDVILFSIGYGPDKNRKLSMNFGPLNNDGGHRRLNVAISRSRKEMVVYTSIKPSMIDLSKTSSKGVEGLKGFLEYAMTGRSALPINSKDVYSAKDALVDDICKAIEERGYKTHAHIGSSRFRVDIGIVDPNNEEEYILGLLCDGPSYKKGNTSRDRNILQPDVLRGLGWNILRIWSLDWFDSRERVLNEIEDTIKRLESKENEPIEEEVKYESKSISIADFEKEEEIPAENRIIPGSTIYKQYKPAKTFNQNVFVNALEDPNGAGTFVLKIYKEIVKCEAPVCTDIAFKRMLDAFGIDKALKKYRDIFDSIDKKAGFMHTVNDDITFIWDEGMIPREYETFRIHDENSEKRAINTICIQERLAAVIAVIRLQLGMNQEDLIKEASKALGFTRTTPAILSAVSDAIGFGLSIEKLKEENGRIDIV